MKKVCLKNKHREVGLKNSDKNRGEFWEAQNITCKYGMVLT